jgi:hypothetical protein
MTDAVRDMEHAIGRLVAAKPRLVVTQVAGKFRAQLVLAEGDAEETEAAAVRSLAHMVGGMLDSNVDHDVALRDRLLSAQ